ncbi:hypothetical protein Nepgr_024594 [Nepenthes gracilis]|uniref:Uncharacterized protein n=1 Tax=Nepenthes gracilis TaxID=150966 RepID=A0AAD3T529_NEPGR|nr:hypothetical protein Nepgr_024594 [Nepenthes gracilis]
MVFILPSISADLPEGYEFTEIPILDVGQTEEVTKAGVVESVEKHLSTVSKQEVRGEEETKVATGAAETLNFEPPELEDITNTKITDMSFEIQPFESEVQINVQTKGFIGIASMLAETQHLMPKVQAGMLDFECQESRFM